MGTKLLDHEQSRDFEGQQCQWVQAALAVCTMQSESSVTHGISHEQMPHRGICCADS